MFALVASGAVSAPFSPRTKGEKVCRSSKKAFLGTACGSRGWGGIGAFVGPGKMANNEQGVRKETYNKNVCVCVQREGKIIFFFFSRSNFERNK